MSAFLAALNAQATTIQTKRSNIVAPKQTPTYPKPALVKPKPDLVPQGTLDRVEVNVSSNRLDLYFTGAPNALVREDMKDKGFWFNPKNKTWYHKDTDANRAFIREYFNIVLDDKQSEAIAPTVASLEAPKETIKIENDEFTESFKLYRTQVNELIKALDVEPADLMLIAIDCLHKATFKKQ